MAGDKSAIPLMVTTVLGLLNVSAITSTLGCAVYDHVPQNAPYPYIALQSPQEINDGAMGSPGKMVFLDAHIFTSDRTDLGSAKVTTIVSKIREQCYFPPVNGAPEFRCGGMFVEDVEDLGDETDQGQTIKHYKTTIKALFVPL
jgi:hypothetical protein